MRFSESDFLQAFGGLFLLTLGMVCGNCWSTIAHADDPTPTRVQVTLALRVAATAANEAGMSSPNDVRLVYDAAHANGRTDARRAWWLRRHSACVNGGDCNRDGVTDARDAAAADARPGNARWTRHLRWDNHRPTGYPSHWRWYPDRWERLRRLALRLVLGGRSTGICGVPIVTWGRRSDFASRPTLAPVECGAANLGGRRLPASRRLALARALR